jgi:cytidylate kinase
MYESSETAHMVEREWNKWLQLTQQRAREELRRSAPTITISRERGSGGSSIGRLAAERLGFAIFDSEIVDHVARSAAVDRMVVARLDEHSQRSIGSRSERVSLARHFPPQSYMAHLTRTLLTIGENGQAVVIGRGAHLILPLERCFRVRVIAPQEVRILRLVTGSGIDRRQAEAQLADTDKQRAEFIRENFQQADSNPLLYDLVINTGRIELNTAAELIVHGVEAIFPQVRQLRAAAERGVAPVPSVQP